jgi:hypothetical protein
MADDRKFTGAAILQNIAGNHRERRDLDPLKTQCAMSLTSQAFNTK